MAGVPPVLRTVPSLRLRYEHFGALAWTTRPRRIFELGPVAAAVTELYRQPRTAHLDADVTRALERRIGLDQGGGAATVGQLVEQGVLAGSGEAPCPLTVPDVDRVAEAGVAGRPGVPVLKPFWVHLQPFTVCNQHCVTCYCSGGPKADPFVLPLQTWHDIIGKLDDYGVLDVYITGGESLLLDGFFDLAEDILSRGLGFGLSTNATVLGGGRLQRLRDLNFSPVQVSLDGGQAATHELIRGVPGCWTRTLAGIRAIGEFAEVVINTVVNRLNLTELEDVVNVGRSLGVRRFKFFPQKPVGRSNSALVLDDETIMSVLVPECARLADSYRVEIETIDPTAGCGSGSIGFAVDQRGDVYPCIFGVENHTLNAGSLVSNDLDALWFSSPVLAAFRGEVTTPCRRCEASCAT